MKELSRVEELAQRVVDGLGDEATIAELEELMRNDRSARIVYLQTLQLHQDLQRKAARESLGESPPEEEVPIEISSGRPRRVSPLLAIAAVLALSAVCGWVWFQFFGQAAGPFAQVTRLDLVDEPLAYHQAFEPGDRIAFNEGILELTYREGTRVVLEGPVDYTLEDSTRGRLELGSLAAEVPPGAPGFTVVTPSAEVKDIGTKFAVALLDTGRTEFEVFEGEVRARGTATGSSSKSFKTGETAAVDDGQTDVQSIETSPNRFRGVQAALNRRTVMAIADRFVQGGDHANQVPADSPDVLLLKQLGANDGVARKVWMRFDLSGQSVDLSRPATLTLHTAKDIRREAWEVQLFGLKRGFQPSKESLGIGWRENSITWNNAPGNNIEEPVKMSGDAELISAGEIRVDPETEPAGTYFTYTIPSLEPFMQDDGSVTLMLSTATGRHKVLNLAAREHREFAGPLLTFEMK